jgi:prophage regulatory protein
MQVLAKTLKPGVLAMSERLLRPKHVQERLAISKATLWRLVKLGKFPAPQKLSERISVWRESVVDEAVNNLLNDSN